MSDNITERLEESTRPTQMPMTTTTRPRRTARRQDLVFSFLAMRSSRHRRAVWQKDIRRSWKAGTG